MTDHPLSKSEIFFYGALSQRLSPLIDIADKSDSIDKWYPTIHEVYPSTVEPFSAIERLAIEFGLARRVELEPAGDDEENPWNPEYRPPIPDDAVWTYADGQPLTDDELDEVMAKLDRAMAESHSGHDGTFCVDFVEKWTANIMSRMIDAIFGIPQWIPMTLREVCFHEVTESMGPFVVEGRSPSAPGYVFRVSWQGDVFRYQVPRQDNPFYRSLLDRFRDELEIPSLVTWSLSDSTRHPQRPPATPKHGEAKPPTLALWIKGLKDRFGNDDEWRLGHDLAKAQFAASLLERHVAADANDLEALAAGQGSMRAGSTRERLDEFVLYLAMNLDDRVKVFENGDREISTPLDEQKLIGGLRYLCFEVGGNLWYASNHAKSAGLHEVASLAKGGAGFMRCLDHAIKSVPSGLTSIDELRQGSRRLADATNDAMKIAYGQLYFRELSGEQVYIDPTTQGKLLREPKAVREQLEEAIRQYERQTSPNFSVTSACGLVEPVVRKMAAAWLPSGEYLGDTATVLKALLHSTMNDLTRIRASATDDDESPSEEADALLKLFCINVAYGLNHLGNTVRHHAHKPLKRHDAGVMLHGLCAILHRL